MTIGQFARRTHLERTRSGVARLRRRPDRIALGTLFAVAWCAGFGHVVDADPRRPARSGSSSLSRRRHSPTSATSSATARSRGSRKAPRCRRRRRRRGRHRGLRRRSSHRAASPSTSMPSARPASPIVRRACASSGSVRSSTRCSRRRRASRRSRCSLMGVAQAASALTLPWAIAVPIGFAAAVVGGRASLALPRHDRLARPLGQALDSIYVAALPLLPPRAPRRPDRHRRLLVRRHRLPLGVPAGLHARAPDVGLLLLGYATGYALTRRTLPFGGAGAVERLLPFALSWTGHPARRRRARGLHLPHLQLLAAARPRSARAAQPAGCRPLLDGDRDLLRAAERRRRRALDAHRRPGRRPPHRRRSSRSCCGASARAGTQASVRLGPSTRTSSMRPTRSALRSAAMRCTTSTSRSIRSRLISSET